MCARFARDDRGSGSTDWLISVAIVVMMAVPVVAVVGSSTQNETNEIVVSIQDTDSFGGAGYHGGEGAADADVTAEAQRYEPGADMGIGYPTEADETRASSGRFSTSAGVATVAGQQLDGRRGPASSFYAETEGGSPLDTASGDGNSGVGYTRPRGGYGASGGFGGGRAADAPVMLPGFGGAVAGGGINMPSDDEDDDVTQVYGLPTPPMSRLDPRDPRCVDVPKDTAMDTPPVDAVAQAKHIRPQVEEFEVVSSGR